jgi:hypothetical protein
MEPAINSSNGNVNNTGSCLVLRVTRSPDTFREQTADDKVKSNGSIGEVCGPAQAWMASQP